MGAIIGIFWIAGIFVITLPIVNLIIHLADKYGKDEEIEIYPRKPADLAWARYLSNPDKYWEFKE